VVAGVGSERARAAAESLVAAGADALLSWGTCGALDPSLRAGALIVPRGVRGPGMVLDCDPRWHRAVVIALSRRIHPVTTELLGVSRALTRPGVKRSVHLATGAAAVDMESHGIGAVAATHGLPFLILRAIVDPAAMTLPTLAVSATGPDGRTDLGRVIRGLLRRPDESIPLLRLGLAFRAASATLRWVGATLGGQFAVP
jgi:adenosylhomocysteine nucleosidase